MFLLNIITNMILLLLKNSAINKKISEWKYFWITFYYLYWNNK